MIKETFKNQRIFSSKSHKMKDISLYADTVCQTVKNISRLNEQAEKGDFEVLFEKTWAEIISGGCHDVIINLQSFTVLFCCG